MRPLVGPRCTAYLILSTICKIFVGFAGTGGYGEVFMGNWHGNEVAIKVLHLDQFSAVGWAAINSEASVMASLRHPNIVTFFGAGVTPNDRAFIVSEFMGMGSLRTVLDNALESDNEYIPWDRRFSMSRDIAAGMRFLHGRSPPLIHRDLKSDNCLLSPTWVTKVADFGAALKPARQMQGPSPAEPPTTHGFRRFTRAALMGPKADKVDDQAIRPRTKSFGSWQIVGSTDSSSSDLLLTATAGAGTPLWCVLGDFA